MAPEGTPVPDTDDHLLMLVLIVEAAVLDAAV